MSRVEDEREAARLAERLNEQRRAEAAQREKKSTENAKFARLVGEQKAPTPGVKERSVAQSTIAQVLEATEAPESDQTRLRARARRPEPDGRQAPGGRHGASREEATRAEGRQAQASVESAQASAGLEGAQRTSSRSTEGRRRDARTTEETLDLRHADAEDSAKGRAPAGGAAKEGPVTSEADGGGGRQDGGGQDQGSARDGAMASAFRLNPALMAPVPVAQRKAESGSERLRKVANELAQKIVERVRVGTNAAGRAEFQVDLRQDVLAGLSVRISAHHGRIKAVFAGADRQVLKLIEQQVDALKTALAGRGLTLEDVTFEARA